MNILKPIVCALSCMFIISCGNVKHVSVLCNQSEGEIYVDGEYLGNGLVSYEVPRDVTTIEIICKIQGKEIARRIVSVRNRALYEIYLTDDYKYSNNRIIYKSK